MGIGPRVNPLRVFYVYGASRTPSVRRVSRCVRVWDARFPCLRAAGPKAGKTRTSIYHCILFYTFMT